MLLLFVSLSILIASSSQSSLPSESNSKNTFNQLPTSSPLPGSPRATGCKFTIPTDVPENEPVYLRLPSTQAGYQPFDPTDRITTLQPGESLHLFCPGNQNVVQNINNRTSSSSSTGGSKVIGQNMTQLACNRQSQFTTPINLLNCTQSVMGDLVTTKRRCGPRAEAVINQMGFKVNARTFITLIEACYNNRSASAQFVRYTINGKAIKCKYFSSYTPQSD